MQILSIFLPLLRKSRKIYFFYKKAISELVQRKRLNRHLAVLVVLRAVARAHEFVGILVPGDNAAQMGANSVHTCQLLTSKSVNYLEIVMSKRMESKSINHRSSPKCCPP